MSLDMELESACSGFLRWLNAHGCESYDPYDIWGTPYGLWARKHYYGGTLLGKVTAAPVVFLEACLPGMRSWWVARERFATADAQLILGLLHLWRATGAGSHLEWAVRLGEELMGYALPGYRGACWGYPFDWRINKDEVWSSGIPFITCTPYGYEALTGLSDAIGEARYAGLAQGVAEFVFRDLREIPAGLGATASSYSPRDSRRVVNAAAYRAFVLGDAALRFGREDYRAAAVRNLNFVIGSQQEDGSWFYAIEDKPSFIDHFHTCFNLKNLVKLDHAGFDERLRRVIAKGYRYYRAALFDRRGDPKPFAVEPRMRIVRWEMYDFAEAINLGTLMGADLEDGHEMACDLATRVISRHQLPDGHFVTRVYRGGLVHRFPFLRWPQAQMFHALAQLCAGLRGQTEREKERE